MKSMLRFATIRFVKISGSASKGQASLSFVGVQQVNAFRYTRCVS